MVKSKKKMYVRTTMLDGGSIIETNTKKRRIDSARLKRRCASRTIIFPNARADVRGKLMNGSGRGMQACVFSPQENRFDLGAE